MLEHGIGIGMVGGQASYGKKQRKGRLRLSGLLSIS